MFLLEMVFTVFVFSWFMTWGLRRYALRFSLLDIPNHRSSHVIPVPRGAGLAIVLSFLIGLAFLNYSGLLAASLTNMFVISGLLVALFGFLDDLYTVSARNRIVVHFIAAAFALYWLGGMPAVTVFGWIFSPGIMINVLAAVYLVWLLNLYNFMDGIDGLAGVEALTVCLGGALLYWFAGNFALMILPLILAASVAGFLYWNMPPARIFMGDVGSGFLGIILGVLSIQAAGFQAPFFWSWLILLGVFIVDATLTLLRRVFFREGVFEAHRNHAYQYASRHFNSHLRVTLAVLALNVFWLLPLALIVGRGYLDGLLGLLIAYVPLIMLALKFNAGKTEVCGHFNNL